MIISERYERVTSLIRAQNIKYCSEKLFSEQGNIDREVCGNGAARYSGKYHRFKVECSSHVECGLL